MEEIDDFEEYIEKKYLILIIYDITENKQRLKIAKYLLSFGCRVQKSSFEARLNKKQYDRLVAGLRGRLKPDDNVRIYKLQGYEEVKTFGNKEYLMEEDYLII